MPFNRSSKQMTLVGLAILLVASYYPMLLMTGRTLISSEEMAHGFFAPIVAGYLVWCKRDVILNPTSRPSAWSLPLLAVAACVGIASTLAMSSTFSRFGFLISLAGCLLLLGGWTALKSFAFPLALLLYTFPIPDVLYGEITQPLQLMATRLSEFFLEFLGYSVIRDGNILRLSYMTLSVVEACSGLRSLITLSFFCLVYAYLFEDRLWIRVLVTLLAIPAAIFVNVLRISSTAILGKYNQEWTRGTYHEVVGWSGFFVGFLLVFLLHLFIHRLSRSSISESIPVSQ